MDYLLAISVGSLFLYFPFLLLVKMMDAAEMVLTARSLNPSDADKIVMPFDVVWAAKCIFFRFEHEPLRTKWYVYNGTCHWQTWEYLPHD